MLTLILILIIGLNVKSFFLGGEKGKKAEKKTKIEKMYKIQSITFKDLQSKKLRFKKIKKYARYFVCSDILAAVI